ncbi:putative PD-(D/E)XK family protein DUF4420 [Nocardia mexicana]|uniref:Putative PD-(D/E)XK family protein DUF4420 n=2 Tax=Nocardia mexicana TaxID=279262 RepID=A0A370GZU3_9NOCA|nr:putative PD-(D/E)XK family protein DUF4420 [Nocardia mexicana]
MLAIARLSSPTAMRVADLPVSTVYGLVAAGVDPEGHRHLLVPIDPRQSVRRGFDGPVIRLARRPLETAVSYQVYADLTCLDPEFDDVFATFCAAALEEIGVSQRRPVKGLYRALDRWKALFQRSGTLLGPEQLAGLYAELLVLRRLLEVNPSAHQWWTGPTGYRHDFASDAVALEVKASLRSDRRRVRVHGLDQLDPPAGGELLLPWFCLEPAEEGASLPGLISEILELIDDEGPVCGLLSLVGYRPADADQYRDKRLRVVDERWYAVDGNFPRLTSDMLNEAGVAVAVQEVEYTIDLSGEAPTPLSEGEVTQCLQRMARESE